MENCTLSTIVFAVGIFYFILRNSKLHTAAGYPDRWAGHAERLLKNSEGQLSYELVKKATFAVTDMFDWMYDHNEDLKNHVELVRRPFHGSRRDGHI